MNSSFSLSDWSNFVQQHFCCHCTCGDEDCYMDAVTPDKSDCLLAEQFSKLFVLDICRYSIESSNVEDEVLDKVFDICENEFRKTYRQLQDAVSDLYPEPPEETRHYYCDRQCYSA